MIGVLVKCGRTDHPPSTGYFGVGMLTISHSAVDGTLIDGTSRGDGSGEVLRAHGWRWFRSIAMWGMRGSRDRAPRVRLIEMTADALLAQGFEVEISIDATVRPAVEVEADRIERQAERVAALEQKAERRSDRAEQAWKAEHRAVEALPPGGEPIKIGHHSEQRHRRALDTAHRRLGQAVSAENDARQAQRRAESAAATTEARYSPVTVKNRIDKLHADQRADQRERDGHERTLFVLGDTKQVEKFPPAQGAYRELLENRIADREDQISYWEAVRAQQIESGKATNYGPDTISKGDLVQWSGGWYSVVRVNKKSVTIPSIVGGSWTDTMPYHKLSGHKRRDEGAQTAAAGTVSEETCS